MDIHIDDKVIQNSFLDDHQLVKQILSCNYEAILFFLRERCMPIFVYINRTRLKDLNLNIDDLVNDFYIHLQENNWEKLRSFRFESKIQTWVSVIASRYLLKKYSKELKEKNLKKISLDGISVYSEETGTCKLIRAELLDAIAQLKDKRHQHVLLLTLQGFDSVQIGERMDLTVNNVYVIKSRAIDKLKTILK